MKIWLNGSLLEETSAALPAHNAGTLLGYGVFTTIGIAESRPIWLDRHLQRLRHDSAHLGLEIPISDKVLCDALHELIKANDAANGMARLTVTASGDGRWNKATSSDISVLAMSAPRAKHQELQLLLSPHRLDSRRPLCGIKSTSYASQQWLWQQAQREGFDEVVLLNENDVVCEGARSNLFWVRNGTLYTPQIATGCLPGIARAQIINWAKDDGVEVQEGSFTLPELLAADEIFLTAATTGPRSVAKLHQSTLMQLSEAGETYLAPGKQTQHFQERWKVVAQNPVEWPKQSYGL
jgi:branched-subunit amino acid aminotransferase/4-amino-4-deoxychorismate lyase